MRNWQAEAAQNENIARDLGLQPGGDPVSAILDYCERKIEGFLGMRDKCDSLSEMLSWVANMVGTDFRVVHTDDDLHTVRKEFINRGEKAIANLDAELAGEVYGITYRLENRRFWQPQFVSVIDCRGDKAPRAYFTKWHEIAHLLTLTQQAQTVFRRTHSSSTEHNPEEPLMDVIAGKFGFYPGVAHKFIKGEISFREVESLRWRLCPEASQQAALINLAKYWPSPCVLMRAEMTWTKSQQERIRRQWPNIEGPPEQALRVVRVTPNERARQGGFLIFKGMRVPDSSIIWRIFIEGIQSAERCEDMSWWSGRPACPVKVNARLSSCGVEALITPID